MPLLYKVCILVLLYKVGHLLYHNIILHKVAMPYFIMQHRQLSKSHDHHMHGYAHVNHTAYHSRCVNLFTDPHSHVRTSVFSFFCSILVMCSVHDKRRYQLSNNLWARERKLSDKDSDYSIIAGIYYGSLFVCPWLFPLEVKKPTQ